MTNEEKAAWEAYCNGIYEMYDYVPSESLERSPFIAGYRAATQANKEKLLEVLEALIDCSSELKEHVTAAYCIEPDGSVHPAMLGKFARDMHPVHTAEQAIAILKEMMGE